MSENGHKRKKDDKQVEPWVELQHTDIYRVNDQTKNLPQPPLDGFLVKAARELL